MRRVGGIAEPLLLFLTLMAGPASAQSLSDALLNGTPLIDLRLRYDTVDEADKPKDAEGTFFRARLGYQTGIYEGFAALVEIDAIQHIGARQFNDSIDRLTQYPTISDPDMLALDRLQLAYQTRLLASPDTPPDAALVVGRQMITFGDMRYIGNSGWRLHEQTYDAVSFADSPLPDMKLTYAYVIGVNRAPGPRSPVGRYDSDSHFFDGVYSGVAHLKLEAFLYLLDFKQAPAFSNATFGLTASGAFDLSPGLSLTYLATAARQRNYGNNPVSTDLGNYRGEAGFSFAGLSGLLGYEVLEGNGTVAFQTPLGLAHPFQGWAETFDTKPPEGMTDAYIKGGYAIRTLPFVAALIPSVAYHDFSAQRVHADYGHEWDAQLEAQVDRRLTLDVAFADYLGGGPFSDKRELWTYATYHY